MVFVNGRQPLKIMFFRKNSTWKNAPNVLVNKNYVLKHDPDFVKITYE